MESKELDLSSFFKERNVTSKTNISYTFKGIKVSSKESPIFRGDFGYNVTKKELEKVVNDIINKENG